MSWAPIRFYTELKRRRLIQTAALYVAVAWGATEILAFLIEGLLGTQASAAARRYLAILLIAGFPAAMYLAWTRDLGLKARRLVSAAAVAVLVTAVLVMAVPEPLPDSALPITENSIAVLPFEVCEDRISDRPLAGGLTGAVLNRLAQRNRLKVMGRRSVETVSESAASVATMAGLLGVEYLLNGIVCRDGLDLTLHAELTDRQGFIVWEKNFTQLVNRFDQVEERLASLVDAGVAAELGDVGAGPTDTAVNRQALEHLLIGEEYARQGQKDEARAEFEKAIEIQPDYAEALFGLALLADADRPIDNNTDARKQAIAIAEQALAAARTELQRDSQPFKANWVAGQILHVLAYWDNDLAYRELHDIGEEAVAARRAQALARNAEAEGYLRSALAINPSESDVRVELTHTMDAQGVQRRKESLDILLHGLDRDFFNARLAQHAALRLVEFGRLREAMDMLDHFDVLPQGKGDDLTYIQLEILNNQRRFDEKLGYQIEILQTNPNSYERVGVISHLWWIVAEIAELGLIEEAENLYTQVAEVPWDGQPWWRQYFLEDAYLDAMGRGDEVSKRQLEKIAGLSNEEILKAFLPEAGSNALAFWNVGDRERAIELFEAIELFPYEATRWAERQMMLPMILASMYMRTGREDDAGPVLQKIVTHLRAEIDAGVRHPVTLMLLTRALVGQTEDQAALEMLDLAIDYGGYDMGLCCEELLPYEPEDLLFGRWWARLEGYPEFRQSRSRMRSLVEQQRSNIRSLLAQNDMDDLLAPLRNASENQ